MNSIAQFVEENNFKVFWNHPQISETQKIANVGFTYANTVNNITYTSCIDHFVGNASVFNSVIEADVLNSADNHSGHLPIYCKIKVGMLNLEIENHAGNPKPSWAKANDEQKLAFQETLDNMLQSTIMSVVCLGCQTLNCQNHSEDIDAYTTSICEALDVAAVTNLPATGEGNKRQRKGVPGWNEYVKPYQEDNNFWHGVWKAAGCPNVGDLHTQYQTSKMQYKYAIRRLKRVKDRIQSNKFVDQLMNGNVNIFNEIKKFRGHTNNLSSCVDGHSSSDEISEHFAEIYSELYSRHNLESLETFRVGLESRINQDLIIDLDRVNHQTVKEALTKLKSGKSDVMFQFGSDCLINGTDSLIDHVTNLFKWFFRTGRIPPFLLMCTLVPIIKDNLGDISSSDNYRAIAIGSLLLKWLEWLILVLEGDKLSSDELQFGFQAGSSTTMCSWAVNTVVDIYNRSGRPVYACTMDLSKAFDLVEWRPMFQQMLDRGVSPLYIRCLLNVYTSQTCNVRWGGSLSRSFAVMNGVRQGAVSSPILFCMYIDNLIKKLRHSNIGCQLQGLYFGVLVYADDLLLLSPSRSGLQAMVKICEKFAELNKLKFSTNVDITKSKTKCVIFTKDRNSVREAIPIFLNGNALPYVNTFSHLGNTLSCDNSMTKDISIKRAKFISRVHSMNQEFYFADPMTMVRLYNIYACSFYGSNLWNLYHEDVVRIYSSWNTAIKILFDLPRNTHRFFVEPVSETPHIKNVLCSRYVSFVSSICSTQKHAIRLLASLCKYDKRTTVGENLHNIANDCNVDQSILSKSTVKQSLFYAPVPDDNIWKIHILSELLDVRKNNYVIHDFIQNETTEMINFICTD